MTQIGEIKLVAKIDTSQYKRGADEVEDANDKMERSADSASRSKSRLSDSLRRMATAAKVATVAGVAALTTATIAAAKASWNQVDAVQQASATLGRYYKNADDVVGIQQELIEYAQSDMGVLFNRKDLFAAAGNLAMYNVEASKVADNVKIISRLAASQVVSWDELNAVIGRVVSSGKLGRAEWEMLNKAGAGLDDSLANTSVTAEQLFKILDDNAPKDLKQDMDNIVPVGIRLSSAFRNIGNSILGVNKLQDGFLPGSLGERIIKFTQGMTQFANDIAPNVRTATTNIINVMDELITRIVSAATSAGEYLIPKFAQLWNTINTKLIPSLANFWRNYIEPLIPVIGVALVGAIGLAVDILDKLVLVMGWVIDGLSNGNPVVMGLAGAFVVFAGAKGVGAAMTALHTFRTVSIPRTIAQIGVMKAAILSPITMPAIAVGAAIAAIWSVVHAHNQAKEAIENNQRMIQQDLESSIEMMKSARRRYDAGEINEKQFRQLVGIASRYQGGPVSAGKAYLVGENRDGTINKTSELFVPNTSGRIINSKDLQSALSGAGGGNSTNITINLSGTFATSKAEQRRVAETIVQRIQEVQQSKALGGAI